MKDLSLNLSILLEKWAHKRPLVIDDGDMVLLDKVGIFPSKNETVDQFSLRVSRDFPFLKEFKDVNPLYKSCDHQEPCKEDLIAQEFFCKWKTLPFWQKIEFKKPTFYPLALAEYREYRDPESNRVVFSIMTVPPRLPWPLSRLYSTRELIHHEWIHAVRSCHVTDIYDEASAYLSSSKAWRVKMGGLLGDFKAQFMLLFIFILNALSFLSLYQYENYEMTTDYFTLVFIVNIVSYFFLIYRYFFLRNFYKTFNLLSKNQAQGLLLRLDGSDLSKFCSLPRSKWLDYLQTLEGPYGANLRRFFKSVYED